jgi:hypothetical protein
MTSSITNSHRAGSVDHQHDIESFAAQIADESSEPGTGSWTRPGAETGAAYRFRFRQANGQSLPAISGSAGRGNWQWGHRTAGQRRAARQGDGDDDDRDDD